MSSWLALMVSVLAGMLVGVPFARWGWWSRIEEDRPWSGLVLWLDGLIYGGGAGALVMAGVSLALTRWLVP